MKRIVSLALLAALLLAGMPSFARADDRPAPIPVLSPEETRETPAGMHHYLLVCFGDNWHVNLNNPTPNDGMVMVTIDEKGKRVMLTSFLRDIIVQRGENNFSRINNIVSMYSPGIGNVGGIVNAKDGKAGLLMLRDLINSHFDLRIEKVIAVDWSMVQNIVDAVGGVDLTLTASEAGYLYRYSIKNWTTPKLTSAAGTYHFPGHAAVIYMRCRHAEGLYGEFGDEARTHRARIVLSAIAKKLANISYEDAMKLLGTINSNILYTNMTSDDLFKAMEMALAVKGTEVEQLRLPINGTYHKKALAGQATQEVDYVPNREALWDFLFGSQWLVEDEDDE